MSIWKSFAKKVARKQHICQRKGCNEIATHHPMLELRVFHGHDPAQMKIGIAVCPLHQPTDASHWISDESWPLIVGSIRAAGKADPIRELTTVTYVPLPRGRAH